MLPKAHTLPNNKEYKGESSLYTAKCLYNCICHQATKLSRLQARTSSQRDDNSSESCSTSYFSKFCLFICGFYVVYLISVRLLLKKGRYAEDLNIYFICCFLFIF